MSGRASLRKSSAFFTVSSLMPAGLCKQDTAIPFAFASASRAPNRSTQRMETSAPFCFPTRARSRTIRSRPPTSREERNGRCAAAGHHFEELLRALARSWHSYNRPLAKLTVLGGQWLVQVWPKGGLAKFLAKPVFDISIVNLISYELDTGGFAKSVGVRVVKN